MPRDPFRHRFRVRLHDTDAAGVLFFAHLFRHAHDAYEAWLEQAGIGLPGLLAAGGPHLPLVHAGADYLAPLRHGEEIAVALYLERIGTRSFTLVYAFSGPGGEPRARARTVHVAVDAVGGNPTSLPETLRTALERLPGSGARQDRDGA